MRWWAFWRRVQYGLLFILLWVGIGTGLYFKYGVVEPTCSDGMQNGTERGVDCGGVCKRVCELDIIQPRVVWAQSFEIREGQYNAVAYLENRNGKIGTPELRYTFRLYDESGLITERNGKTVFPPDSTYPIFEDRIMTEGRVPTRTEVVFDSGILWLPGETGREQFTLQKRELINADSKPKLTAELYNTSLDEAQETEVVATIFNAAREPLTAARTTIQYFPGRSTQSVVFTWPLPIAKTLRSCEIPTDVILAIDLSGSMNNDAPKPPEPLTSVLLAAESFVGRLNTQDQIGIVTYATEATLREPLTEERERIGRVVRALTIDPKEERGTTNTGDGLRIMNEGLNSERHNIDARKIGILLTDGLATGPGDKPEEYAVSQATLLKDTGASLFTIGLGQSANDMFLRTLASTEQHYFKAPASDDLDAIYKKISESICEEGASIIEIVPKAKTSFTNW